MLTPPRRSPRMAHLCSDRVTHQKRRTLIRKPQVGKALSSPPKAGRWVRFREQTRVISRECRRTPELRHASALPDLPTYLTCPAFAVLCPPSVSCSRLIGPRSYPCLCPAPSTPAKRPQWPSEPSLIAPLLPIPFDAGAWHHPTTLDAESLSAERLCPAHRAMIVYSDLQFAVRLSRFCARTLPAAGTLPDRHPPQLTPRLGDLPLQLRPMPHRLPIQIVPRIRQVLLHFLQIPLRHSQIPPQRPRIVPAAAVHTDVYRRGVRHLPSARVALRRDPDAVIRGQFQIYHQMRRVFSFGPRQHLAVAHDLDRAQRRLPAVAIRLGRNYELAARGHVERVPRHFSVHREEQHRPRGDKRVPRLERRPNADCAALAK